MVFPYFFSILYYFWTKLYKNYQVAIPKIIRSKVDLDLNNTVLEFNKIVTVGTNETFTTIRQAMDYLCDNNYKTNFDAVCNCSGIWASNVLYASFEVKWPITISP